MALALVGIASVLAAGCGRPPPSVSEMLGSPARFQTELQRCEKELQVMGRPNPECLRVSRAGLRISHEAALGLARLYAMESRLRAHRARDGRWPSGDVSDAQAPATEPRTVVSVGPRPGEISLTWESGGLAGMTLVAVPGRIPGCWELDRAATTLPPAYLQIAVLDTACIAPRPGS